MAASTLADPKVGEHSPSGNVTTAPSDGAEADGARANATPAKTEDVLEHGWTGLGLPAVDESAITPPVAKATPEGAPAEAPAAKAPDPPQEKAPERTSAPPRASAPPPAKAPEPAQKSGKHPAAGPPRPAPRPMPPPRLPPRPPAKPGPPAAAAPPPEKPQGPPIAQPHEPPALAQESPSRPSFTGPAVHHAPAPEAAPEAARGPSQPPVVTGEAAPGSPAPPAQDADEVEVEPTIEEEVDFGATIPDPIAALPDHLANIEDLGATVPMLPLPQQAPSFGLPPPAAGRPPEPVAPPYAAGQDRISFSTSGEQVALAQSGEQAAFAQSGEQAAFAQSGEQVALAQSGGYHVPASPDFNGAAAPEAIPPSPYGPGAIIADKYQLIRVIGQGGMGSVWIARNTALDVEVAIKLMRRDRATPEATARFTTEARAAAKLGHASIVRVFDFGETSRGDPFIVMELLRGESFGALLARKKKLAPTIAVQTLLPVAHALAAAHAKGIIHRDLKPDNILLAKDESGVVTPKVVDFGIAKLITTDPDRHFTIAGEVLGSPDYMSPEQARGEEDIDHRSDIWTFSVLLYEAISGKRPFEGANYNALLATIIATRPAPIMDHGIAEPALWRIIEKGLAKERDGRWQAFREFGIELAKWALERGVEHDLVGAALSAQWIEPTRKRLFTVAGSAPPANAPAAPSPSDAEDVAIPPPPRLGNFAAHVTKATEAPSTMDTLPPFAPRRRPWVALVLVAIVGAAVALLLSLGGAPEADDPSPAGSPTGPTPSATTAPSTTTASTIGGAASASASASATSSAAPATGDPTSKATSSPASTRTYVAPPGTRKITPPQVKGDIKF